MRERAVPTCSNSDFLSLAPLLFGPTTVTLLRFLSKFCLIDNRKLVGRLGPPAIDAKFACC